MFLTVTIQRAAKHVTTKTKLSGPHVMLHLPLPNVTKRLLSTLHYLKYHTIKGSSASLQISHSIFTIFLILFLSFLSNSEIQKGLVIRNYGCLFFSICLSFAHLLPPLWSLCSQGNTGWR